MVDRGVGLARDIVVGCWVLFYTDFGVSVWGKACGLWADFLLGFIYFI